MNKNIDFFKNKILFCFSCNSNENKSKKFESDRNSEGSKILYRFW